MLWCYHLWYSSRYDVDVVVWDVDFDVGVDDDVAVVAELLIFLSFLFSNKEMLVNRVEIVSIFACSIVLWVEEYG